MSQKNCMFCGQKATLLCDYIIGYDGEEDSAGVMLAMPKKMHTCDAPMCRECATWHGNLFFSGTKHGNQGLLPNLREAQQLRPEHPQSPHSARNPRAMPD